MSPPTAPINPIPHTRPADWPDRPQGRFAATIATDLSAAPRCKAALLGMPDDLGVRLNQGRPGAAQGPAAIRAALARFGVDSPAGGIRFAPILDAGDIIPATTLAETHQRVTDAALAIHRMGLVPIGLGGGHDLTFPFVRAAHQARNVRAGLYTDAHLDVRPTEGSGMPFRALFETCNLRSLSIVGIRWFVNTDEHFRYFTSKGGTVIRRPATSMAQAAAHLPQEPCFVSIDLDAIDASQAPGVSALNPNGLTVEHVAAYAHAAGASPHCACFDIMELCPPHDEQGRTARVAAYILLRFLAGLAERPIPQSLATT